MTTFCRTAIFQVVRNIRERRIVENCSKNYWSLAEMYYGGDRDNEQYGQGGYGHHRGRGGHRGNRGHRGHRHERRPKSTDGGRGSDRDDNRERPPAGLKGRDIGMWYAKRSKVKTAQRDKDQRPEVKFEGQQEANIKKLLHDIKSTRDCPPQPEQSGSSMPNSDSEESMDWFDKESNDIARDRKTSSTQNASDDFRIPTSGVGQLGATALSATTDQLGAELMDDTDIEGAGDSGLPMVTELMKYNAEEDYMTKDDGKVALPDGEDIEDIDALSEELFRDLDEKQRNNSYIKMQTFRKKLPSYKSQTDILDLIQSNQVVVLSGETGCGKTTQVPQFILDEYIRTHMGADCRIICTQPRRISAISVAERVAAERAENCGQSVGYMIRLENKLPRPNGSILYCTTGILLKVLENDPLLHRATHIILDEIHERDLLSDFLIIILKDILKKRPDLKLILMSATLNAEAFSKYFDNSPRINIPGFTYPVEEFLLEDVIEMLRYQVPEKMMKKQRRFRGRKTNSEPDEEEEYKEAWLRNLEGGVNCDKIYSRQTIAALRMMDMTKIDVELIKSLIHYIIINKGDGAILVFVPGWSEISDLHKLLTSDRMFNSDMFRIIPLHSMMPTLNQREVFERPPPGVRKIVIATNIAETSITIDDIVFVIDGGRIKVKNFSPETNLLSLASELVSKANSRQRRGRAGRVQPGECYHLYTDLQESLMQDYLPPEILRTRLEELCLQIKLLKLGEIIPFVSKAMQPPSMAALKSAIENLQNLNALDKDENLLPLGNHLARMPLDPHTGKMILFGAMFGCLDPILTIAASLNFKDPFFIPLGKEKLADQAKMVLGDGCHSDHILLVKAFEKWERSVARGTNGRFCWDNFMSESTLRMLKKMRGQLAEVLHGLGFLKFKNPSQVTANRNSDNTALIKAIVCAGLYPNVAKIKSLPSKHRSMLFTAKDGSKCELHPKSIAKDVTAPGTQWVIYHKKMKTSSVWLYDCSLVSPYSLLFFGGDILQFQEEGVESVSVDDWIKFKASPNTIKLVKELRHELDAVLEEKIIKTSDTNWAPMSKEGAILKAIIDLVTTEDTNSQNTSERKESYGRQSYKSGYRR